MATQSSVTYLVDRANSLADLRAQYVRKISDEIQERLSVVATMFREAAGGLEEILNTPAPLTREDVTQELRQLRAAFTRRGFDLEFNE